MNDSFSDEDNLSIERDGSSSEENQVPEMEVSLRNWTRLTDLTHYDSFQRNKVLFIPFTAVLS